MATAKWGQEVAGSNPARPTSRNRCCACDISAAAGLAGDWPGDCAINLPSNPAASCFQPGASIGSLEWVRLELSTCDLPQLPAERHRRLDSSVYDGLVQRFGGRAVFQDVAAIRPGRDFRLAVDQAVDRSDVALVVIGPGWLASDAPGGTAEDSRSRRSLAYRDRCRHGARRASGRRSHGPCGGDRSTQSLRCMEDRTTRSRHRSARRSMRASGFPSSGPECGDRRRVRRRATRVRCDRLYAPRVRTDCPNPPSGASTSASSRRRRGLCRRRF